MPATALPENYCVCVNEDGAPREIGRSGSAITYKAIGYQSGHAVALQLIPLANISESGRPQFEAKAHTLGKLKHPNIARVFEVRVEDDHLVFATEYLEGETAEQWVVAHGPMSPDAVVRIALQIVSALAEAAFHSLSHRAIQPSNLMIVNGVAPDGSWPFVKLLNFGMAGLKLYTEGDDALVAPISAAFASPEQLEKGKVDFRSEVFSLGATICFLLTGAVPLAGRSRGSETSERALPSRVPIPRSLRKLLRRMLRINPDERPHDPLLLTDELRKCLQKVERRRAFSRDRVALPETAPLEAEQPRSWFAPVIGAAAVLLLLAGLAAALAPGKVRSWTHRDRPIDSIGVPIGVPETAPAAPTTTPRLPERAKLTESNSSVAAVAQTTPASSAPDSNTSSTLPEKPSDVSSSAPAEAGSAAPAVPEETSAPGVASASAAPVPTPAEENKNAPAENSTAQSPPVVAEETKPAAAATPAPVNAKEESGETAMAEPPPPEEAPAGVAATPLSKSDVPAPAIAQEQQPIQAQEQNAAAPEPSQPEPTPAAKIAERASEAQDKVANSVRRGSSRRRERSLPPLRVGGEQARFVRTTPEGKWVLRLPSGNTVVTPPLPDVNDAPVISHRRVRKVVAPPRALPLDDGQPVVVLPPD